MGSRLGLLRTGVTAAILSDCKGFSPYFNLAFTKSSRIDSILI